MLQMAHKWYLCVNFNSDCHRMSEKVSKWGWQKLANENENEDERERDE